MLPLELSAPRGASVGNFDSNRNGDPGITIEKDGGGFATTDSTKVQIFEFTFAETTRVSGTPQVELYVAARGFDTSKNLGIAVAIERCSPVCSTLTTSTWSSSGEASWRQAILGFASLDETIQAGESLRLRIIAPDSLAEDDMMIAYDAVPYSSVLRVVG